MFTVLTEIDWLAALIAFVVSAGLAAVYFPVLIAKPYVVALGRQDAGAAPTSPARNLGPIVCILVTTLASTILLRALDVTSIGDAIVFGIVVGVGYLTAMTFQIALNPNFPRPLLYGLINAPYFVVSSLVTSVILTLIR